MDSQSLCTDSALSTPENEFKANVTDDEKTQKQKIQCAQCDSTDAQLRCGRCRLVYYCNRECQLENWAAHKIHCKVSRKTINDRIDDVIGKIHSNVALVVEIIDLVTSEKSKIVMMKVLCNTETDRYILTDPEVASYRKFEELTGTDDPKSNHQCIYIILMSHTFALLTYCAIPLSRITKLTGGSTPYHFQLVDKDGKEIQTGNTNDVEDISTDNNVLPNDMEDDDNVCVLSGSDSELVCETSSDTFSDSDTSSTELIDSYDEE